MHFRIGVASLVPLAIVIVCGGSPGDDKQSVVPTPAGPPAMVTDAKSPPRPTPRNGRSRATTTPVFAAVPSPVTLTSPPTPSTTPPPPTTPAATVIPATDTPRPDPTGTQSDPVLSPTIDIAQQIARGRRLVERNNCLGCHSVDGRTYSAPTLKGLFGSIRQLEGGATATADEEYLRESIKRPNEKIVLDYFPDAMPAVFFSDAEVDAMVEYIKSLE